MQMKMKVGIGLIALGAGVWAAWSGWTRTRKMDPVDVPIAIAGGEGLRQRFTLNYDGRYVIEVAEEGSERTEAGGTSLGAEWSVWNDGRELGRGTADDARSAPPKSRRISIVLGEFNGQAGQSYELRVRFTRDTPESRTAKPRLKVRVSGLAKENLDAASVLLFSIVSICEFFGLILVGIATWAKAHRASSDANEA